MCFLQNLNEFSQFLVHRDVGGTLKFLSVKLTHEIWWIAMYSPTFLLYISPSLAPVSRKKKTTLWRGDLFPWSPEASLRSPKWREPDPKQYWEMDLLVNLMLVHTWLFTSNWHEKSLKNFLHTVFYFWIEWVWVKIGYPKSLDGRPISGPTSLQRLGCNMMILMIMKLSKIN